MEALCTKVSRARPTEAAGQSKGLKLISKNICSASQAPAFQGAPKYSFSPIIHFYFFSGWLEVQILRAGPSLTLPQEGLSSIHIVYLYHQNYHLKRVPPWYGPQKISMCALRKKIHALQTSSRVPLQALWSSPRNLSR